MKWIWNIVFRSNLSMGKELTYNFLLKAYILLQTVIYVTLTTFLAELLRVKKLKIRCVVIQTLGIAMIAVQSVKKLIRILFI